MVPPGVMSVLPDEAVAPEKTRLPPWFGATFWLQVSVWLESVSLTCRRLLISVALAFWFTVKVVVLPTKVGAVLVT